MGAVGAITGAMAGATATLGERWGGERFTLARRVEPVPETAFLVRVRGIGSKV